MVAPQDPLLCSTSSFTDEEVAAALADPRVLGMGEIVSWLRLLQCDGEILDRLVLAHRRGQIIHGHTAGARDQKLCAVAAVGISSCHEPIRFEDALERLRLGYWTMLREGSLRQDLGAILPRLIASGVNLQRLILVTDSMTPDEVAERGHMDHVVRRAISFGLTPMQAMQSVTVNPALYSGLDQEIGGIAPGRRADMLLLDDLEACRVRDVLISGKVVARNGVSAVSSTPIALPEDLLTSLRLGVKITRESFRIPVPTGSTKVRVMALVNQTITAELLITLPTPAGAVEARPADDLLKVAMFDRHGRTRQVAFGLLKGWGAKIGAVGVTTNLDENALMIVGSDDVDMALCANILLEAGGGMAIVERGVVLEKLELPCGGIFSLEPWRMVGQGMRRIQDRLRAMGSSFDKPIFALSFLPFVTLPALRITARGLVNAKERKIVPLVVD
jgi:adenine deaminase